MWNWIHHILEPHCPECKAEREEQKICQSCEMLKTQLDIANYDRKQMLQALLDASKPPAEVAPTKEYEPIKPKTIPWLVKRQMLEAEDKIKAKIIADNKKLQEQAASNTNKNVEELEKELGVK